MTIRERRPLEFALGAVQDITGVVVNLSVAGVQHTGNIRHNTGEPVRNEAYGDKLTGIEQLVGSPFNDILAGEDGANVLRGGNYRYASYNGDLNIQAVKHGTGNKIAH